VKTSSNIPISRRDFMKLAGLATAGVILNPSVEKVEAAERLSGEKIKYAGKEIPLLYNVDVCVCGGGPSGTAAAISAARNGAKVVLIEKGIALGGLATLGCVYPLWILTRLTVIRLTLLKLKNAF
jgi:NADPH-dependent 2,4-dienoyl-CoA reductase/sulfur reductase-like enzyme